jgi:hypothetical protein
MPDGRGGQEACAVAERLPLVSSAATTRVDNPPSTRESRAYSGGCAATFLFPAPASTFHTITGNEHWGRLAIKNRDGRSVEAHPCHQVICTAGTLYPVHVRLPSRSIALSAAHAVLLESRLDVRRGVLEADTAISVALRDSLPKRLRKAEKLVLARAPNTGRNCAGREGLLRRTTCALRRGRILEVALDAFRKCVDELANVLGIEFAHDLLERGARVRAARGHLRRRRRLQQTLDALEIILREREQSGRGEDAGGAR